MATGLILVLIVGALGYLGTIYTSPALILLSICCGVMLFLGYGYIFYMMLRVKCRIQIPIIMAEQEEGVMICAVTENRSRLPLPKVVYRMDYRCYLWHNGKPFLIAHIPGQIADSKQAIKSYPNQPECIISTAFCCYLHAHPAAALCIRCRLYG